MSFNKRVIDSCNEESERRVSARVISSSSNITDKEIISNLRIEILEKDKIIEKSNSIIKSLSKDNINLTNSNLDLSKTNSSLELNNSSLEVEIVNLTSFVSEINSKYATLLDIKNDLDHLITDYPHKLAFEIINW